MEPILHGALRDDVRASANGLPGTRPLNPRDWLQTDEAHAGQMALRDELVRIRREEVVALRDSARPAAEDLDEVLSALGARSTYRVGADVVLRPDGVVVPVTRDDPLGTLGRLVQEDFCLLLKQSDEHVLRGAVLCFPSRWTLAEKMDRPLTAIHAPVAPYGTDLARRVQRLFDGVEAGRPLWRANLIRHQDPALFQPMPEAVKPRAEPDVAPYLRAERQCILRLPRSGAVVFSIHTTLVRP